MRLGFSDGPVSVGPPGTRSTWGVLPARGRAGSEPDAPAGPVRAQDETGLGAKPAKPPVAPAGGDSEGRPEAGGAKNAPVIKRLSFVFYGEAGDALVRVYDAITGELLREIPPQVASIKGDLGGPPESGSPAR